MKSTNRLRLLSGLPMDLSIEKDDATPESKIVEAREIPMKMGDLTPTTAKAMMAGVNNLTKAITHITQAVKSLEKVPSMDYNAVVPRYISELETLLNETPNGLNAYLQLCQLAIRQEMAARDKKEDNDGTTSDKNNDGGTIREDIINSNPGIPNDEDDCDQVDESMNFYVNMGQSNEEDPTKPVNVADGNDNWEQVWDQTADTKTESPEQLKTGDSQSKQDQSDGLDIEAKMTIPASIKKQLANAISDARAESKRMSVSNKEAAGFYDDLANAFGDIKTYLDTGDRYDFKLAQNYVQTLMGPILHKIPTDVWKFLANGGVARSLKDYINPVNPPITGPRNTIN